MNSGHTGTLKSGMFSGTAEDDCRDQEAAANPADTHSVSGRPRSIASNMPAAKLENKSYLSIIRVWSLGECYSASFSADV